MDDEPEEMIRVEGNKKGTQLGCPSDGWVVVI
jgi:hypothetical protein